MIKYVLTSHAEQRIRHRSIKIEEIEKVLNDPDYSYPGKQGELNLVKELSERRKIRVVVRSEKNKMKIITAIIVN
jgi:hypothetical protein